MNAINNADGNRFINADIETCFVKFVSVGNPDGICPMILKFHVSDLK